MRLQSNPVFGILNKSKINIINLEKNFWGLINNK